MELLQVDSVAEVQEKIAQCTAGWQLETESLPINQLIDRILGADIVSQEDIPAFARSTVDGFAVKSRDTAAAGESIPVFLKQVGTVEMGMAAQCEILSGQCAEVPTGGMLPEGSDAVVMVEYSESFGSDGVALYQGVAVGENVVLPGDDAKKGATLLRRGKRVLPQDVGAMAAAGVTMAQVYKPLKLTIISTGDELVPPDEMPLPGQVRDINTYALKILAEKSGFTVVGTAVLHDDVELLTKTVRSAMESSDVVAVSGGSSQGKKDATRVVLDAVSNQGVFTHGMAIKPGKPTIVGYDKDSETLLTGLPGHPVSAMMVFEILFCTLWRELTGLPKPPSIPASLTVNLGSAPGKLNCWPVKLSLGPEGYLAQPVFGKSGLITTLTNAAGYFTVDRNTEGLRAGEQVWVHLF